jgi:hypothetical protein
MFALRKRTRIGGGLLFKRCNPLFQGGFPNFTHPACTTEFYGARF